MPAMAALSATTMAPETPPFEALYYEHVSFVWRTLRHLGVAEADAEDAVQDVFLVVHDRISSFAGRSQLSTWIYGICLHVAQARRRRAHVRRELLTDPEELVLEAPIAEADAADALEKREAEDMLDRILDTMPLEQRSVFTLFELDGCSCEEIAEITAAPIGTVYSRLRLAREAFRRATTRLQAQLRFPTGGAR
jgi:RNA polymerase sigma-70 factor (ECF subfamily)